MAEFRDQAEQADHVRDPARDDFRDHALGDHDVGSDHGTDLAQALGNQRVNAVLGSGVHRDGATGAQQLDEAVARTIEQRRGAGATLDDGTRRHMEASLGHDLSDVRVHTDATADGLNDAVGARAFTTGSDVFFKQGLYDPGSSSGRELLGHELTHVVQQRNGTSGLGSGEVSDPSDRAEVDAAESGRRIANEAAPPAAATTATSGPTVARQEEDEELQLAREPGVARDSEEEDELMMDRDDTRSAS